MPQYFVATAYLLDAEKHYPLCDEYTTQMYTKYMQEFLDMTTDDFADDQVLNLDDDKTNNFAVYSDSTKVVPEEAGQNQVADNGDGTYTISNATSEVTSLKAGDIFTCTGPDGEPLILKVKEAEASGSTVTITEDTDVELEEVFDYVKIEGGYKEEEARAGALEFEDSSHSVSKSFNWTKEMGSGAATAALKASGTLTAAPYIRLYLALKYQCVEMKVNLSASFDCSAEGKISRQTVDLLKEKLTFKPVAGVQITFMPSLEFEASGEASFSAKLVSAVGFSYDSVNGPLNKSVSPYLNKCEFHIEATVYLGLSIQPGVALAVKKVEAGSITLKAQPGVQITGKMDLGTAQDGDSIHTCTACIAGDITGKIAVSVTLEVAYIGSKTFNVVNGSAKVTDFYYSIDHNEFGWTTCPYVKWKVTLSVADASGNPVAGASVEGTGLDAAPSTDSSGKATFYLDNGSYTLSATKDGFSGQATVKVDGAAQEVQIKTEDTSLVDSGSCGPDVQWKLYKDGSLSISGSGDMTSYSTSSTVPWYSKRSQVVTISVGSGITNVGNYAFSGCSNLTAVTVPEGVTEIGQGAFSGCTKLASVDFPASLVKIGDSAFYYCSALESAALQSGVTSIGNSAFYGCASLPGMDIPGSVSTLGTSAFYNCTGLKSVVVPSSVNVVQDSAFSGCTGMTQASVDGKSIGSSAFYGCTSLTTLTLGDNVTGTIGSSAFKQCTSLRSLVIPSGVIGIGDSAFYGCSSLASVTVGDGVVYIGGSAFCNCSSLTSVTIGSGVTDIGASAFNGCTSLAKISIPSNVTTLGIEVFRNCTQLSDVTLGNGLTRIPSSAFDGCTSLLSITIPSNITSILNYAFEKCSSLTYVYFTGNRPTLQVWPFYGLYLTIYYPSGNSTWDSVVNSSYYEGATVISWIPYEPSATSSESAAYSSMMPAPEAVDASEKEVEEAQGETGEEAVDASDPNAAYIESSVPAVQGISKADTHTARATAIASRTARFTGVANTALVLLVVKDKDADRLMSADNLLYIAQTVVDSSGEAVFTYIPRTDDEATDEAYYRPVTPDATPSPTPTAEPSPTAKPSPTVAPSPTAKPTPSQTAKPNGTSLRRVKNKKGRKVVIAWKKAGNVSGYQIQYSTARNFKGAKKKSIAGAKRVSVTLTSLRKGKKYYIRIRTYKNASGKKRYSAWSRIKAVTVKR